MRCAAGLAGVCCPSVKSIFYDQAGVLAADAQPLRALSADAWRSLPSTDQGLIIFSQLPPQPSTSSTVRNNTAGILSCRDQVFIKLLSSPSKNLFIKLSYKFKIKISLDSRF
ncbi:hypothetical protein O181_002021 [Austropuccinia psidii MF-1]|uniref:Uncharacterized protein n=1 Tax=Austropuccinia psidii MF-1 TaxID=1389203 RepID=A0A9Q3BC84_9BASI|nr:hypothetical protein [Austropuccinia psidii MF-1]